MNTPLLEPALQYEAELEALVNEISNGVSGLRGLSGREREERIDFLKKRAQHAETVFRTVQVESRELDQAKRRQVQARTKNMYTTLKRLQASLEEHGNRGDLLGGQAEMETYGSGSGGASSSAQIVQRTTALQEDSMASVERSKRIIGDTEEIGVSTTAQLSQQREQLVRIGENLDTIEDELKRADKLIRSFVRRMATDRIVLCFLFLIVLGVLFIIGYQIYKKVR